MNNDTHLHLVGRRMERCPSGEDLCEYLTEKRSSFRFGNLETHMAGCDRCVERLVDIERALHVARATLDPVPISLFERAAQVAVSVPAAGLAADGAWQRQAPVARVRGRRWLGWLWEMPLAFAAGAMLYLAAERVVLAPEVADENMRGSQITALSRRATVEADLHGQPSTASPVLGIVPRDAQVEVIAEQGDWSQVQLADGRSGWVQEHAFE